MLDFAISDFRFEHQETLLNQRGEGCNLKSQSYELPISTPVINTRTPPRPTCRAAVTQGVSM